MSKEQTPKVKARSCDFCRRRKGAPGLYFDGTIADLLPSSILPASSNLSLRAKLQSLSGSSSRPDSFFHQEGYNSKPATEPTVSGDSEDLPGDELASRFQQFSIDSVKNQFGYSRDRQYCHGDERRISGRTGGIPCASALWEEDAYDCHYIFPKPDLVTSLVQIYFAAVHPTILILHRVDKPWAVNLSWCMFENASRQCPDDPRVFVEGDDTTLSAGWKFASQIQILPRTASEPTRCIVYEFRICTTLAAPSSWPPISSAPPFLKGSTVYMVC
ncbi:hypothetical protein C8R46DRAFT_1188951 [Mycena filopes]|nr:hypothetical protein C8R46DRAFT_1188951 [Mycena filopes]